MLSNSSFQLIIGRSQELRFLKFYFYIKKIIYCHTNYIKYQHVLLGLGETLKMYLLIFSHDNVIMSQIFSVSEKLLENLVINSKIKNWMSTKINKSQNFILCFFYEKVSFYLIKSLSYNFFVVGSCKQNELLSLGKTYSFCQ